MSVHVLSPIWKFPAPMAEKIVLLKMADCANDDGAGIWMSVPKMAKQCGCTDRHVQNVIKKYVAAGVLVVEGKPYKWEHKDRVMPTTLYRIDVERVTAIQGEPRSGVNEVRKEGEPRSDKPSLEPSKNSLSGARASASDLNALQVDDELSRWFDANAPNVEPHALLEELRLYCESTGKTYKDYRATLKRWALREKGKSNGKRNGAEKQSPHAAMYAGFARAATGG